MSAKQKAILWLGIIVFVVMGLFPPWIISLKGGQRDSCYGFIWKPPLHKWKRYGDVYVINLDIGRLSLQWAMVAMITGGLLVTFKNKKN